MIGANLAKNQKTGRTVTTQSSQIVIFFDGVCVLCNGAVSFLIKADKKKHFKYASLQGHYAREVLDQKLLQSLSSVVVNQGSQIYEKSEAVIFILKNLGPPYRFLGAVAHVLPTFLLNSLYDIIASYRYRIFGKFEQCKIPEEKNRDLYLN